MNQFSIDTTKVSSATASYSHGFSIEEVDKIKKAKEAIQARDLAEEPVTMEEFKTVIVPWNRIHRVEQFILHPPKVKEVRKPRVAKIAKPKKLTKKAIEKKLTDIIFKQATGESLTEEEEKFFNLHTTKLEAL